MRYTIKGFVDGIAYLRYNDRAGQCSRKRPRWLQKAGGDSMTNVELLAVLIAIASLALTIYFGSKR